MRRVILESPYRGKNSVETERNVTYAKACIRDSLARGEAPLASHLLYTHRGILKDTHQSNRKMGMNAGWAWYPVAEACVVYTDCGISEGMQMGMEEAKIHGVPIEERSIAANALKK